MTAFLKKKGHVLHRKQKASWRLSPLQLQLILGVVIFIVIALIIATVAYLTRIESFQIKNVEVIGGETINHAVVKQKVNDALSGSYFSLIPKRFIFLYPKKEVVESVYTLDRVKNVHAEMTGDQTLSVVFDEHIPYGLWCAEVADESCLFIDHTGFAFAPAPVLEGSAFVRYMDDTAPPVVETQGFDNAFFKETSTFIAMLEEQLSLYVTHIYKRGKYDVDYTISGGGIIKVSQSIPMQDSFDNLLTILSSEEFAHIEPGAFQYIDLRFGDKIFVNEEIAAPKADAATSTGETSNP